MAQSKTDRDARLRAALRENLRKRKMQDRETREGEPSEPEMPRED